MIPILAMTAIHFAAPAWPKPTPDALFLRAIREVESGDNPRKIGKLGERGTYQFRKSTWQMMKTRLPFRLASNRSASDIVASAYLNYLRERTRERCGKCNVTYWGLALDWNAGPARKYVNYLAAYDYADRVMARFRELKGEYAQ